MSQEALTIKKKVDTDNMNRAELRRHDRMRNRSRKRAPKQYHLNRQEVAGMFAIKAHNERELAKQKKEAVNFKGTEVKHATFPGAKVAIK